MLQLTVRK